MKITKLDIAVLGAAALSFAGLVMLLPKMPRTIPTHWNFANQSNGWGPNWVILALGIMPAAVWLIMKAAPLAASNIYPSKTADERHSKAYAVIAAATVFILMPVAWIVAAAAFGYGIDFNLALRLILGILFVVAGNSMKDLKPNSVAGIRTPWTMADPEVWLSTHRRGAFVFSAMGLCLLASTSVSDPASAAAFGFGPSIIGILYVILYSYLESRRIKRG